MNREITTTASRSRTKEICVSGIFIALTLVATMFINIRLPFMGNGGLIHLGNVPMFLAAIIYGKKTGALAGAFGMGMFDLISGWTVWAPFTFVIVGLMGYVTGAISSRDTKHPYLQNALAMFVALLIKIGGYYIAEGIIFGNWIAPVGSIPGNLVQVITAAVIVLPIADKLKQLANKF